MSAGLQERERVGAIGRDLGPLLQLLPTAVSSFAQTMSVKAVLPVTHDVSTFVFEPPHAQTFSFTPGQYLILSVVVDGEHLERCYTISSPPTRPHLLSITVKRVPGGPVSNALHDTLAAGSQVEVSGPYGQFTLTEHPSDHYLFLSAGSGITPMMSMTRTLADLAEGTDVCFVHSARSPADIVFRRELEALSAGWPGLQVTSICEGPSPGEVWSGPRGRLSTPLLAALVPDITRREVFVCGPPPYMAAAYRSLMELGVPPEQCHQESFTFEPATHPLCAVPDEGGGDTVVQATRTIEFVRTGRSVECPIGTTVLQAATAAGVPIRSACRQGMCGTCKSDLVSGDVDIQHAGGIRPREIAAGKFLPCCSYPLGDLVVDA